MDKRLAYQTIIHQIVSQAAEQYGIGRGDHIEQVVVMDDQRGIYQIYEIGWNGHERIKTPWLHVRLKNDKLWIEEDWTEESVVEQLLAAGVPNDHIILAFNPPDIRELTEFATA